MGKSSEHTARAGLALRSLALALVVMGAIGCASFGRSPLEEAQDRKFDRLLASKGLGRSSDRRPQSVEEGVAKGDRLRSQGEAGRAVVAYFRALDMDPEATEPRERIGFMHLSHDVERAEAIFLGLLEEDPSRASAWRGLGIARLASGELDSAADALRSAVELDPDSAGAHYGLATVLGLQGQSDAAVRHARRAQALRPDNAAIANVLGVSLMLGEDLPAAEEALRVAVRLAPDMPTYHNNLALVLGKQGQYRKALQSFRRAGNEQAALNNLGYSYFLNGRYDEAIAHYEHALAEPGDHKVDILRNLNTALDARDQSPASPSASP